MIDVYLQVLYSLYNWGFDWVGHERRPRLNIRYTIHSGPTGTGGLSPLQNELWSSLFLMPTSTVGQSELNDNRGHMTFLCNVRNLSV